MIGSDESDAKALAVFARFLAGSFHYPRAEFVTFLRSRRSLFQDPSWNESQRWFDGFESPEELLLALEEEYTRLFITAFPTVVASPYESSYRLDQTPAEVLLNLSQHYAAEGFEVIPLHGFRPDHVAVELEFAARLLERGQVGGYHVFEQEHPDRWFGPFAGKIAQTTTNPYYLFVAASLETWQQMRFDDVE
jgi:TorA maturation chaperone TorD